jgi:hypothetical protein
VNGLDWILFITVRDADSMKIFKVLGILSIATAPIIWVLVILENLVSSRPALHNHIALCEMVLWPLGIILGAIVFMQKIDITARRLGRYGLLLNLGTIVFLLIMLFLVFSPH